MTPTDDMAAKTDFDNQFEEQLRAIVKDVSLQPRLVEDLHGFEDIHSLLSRHLDFEATERRAIYHRLQAIESAVKRRRSRGIVRYLVAIAIGVVATLAWQSYGATTKQIIATKAPELGWSPETRQMITGWVQQLGWTKQSAGPESAGPETPQPIPEPPSAPARKPTPTATPSSRAPTPPL
jgi:hypothetical protein